MEAEGETEGGGKYRTGEEGEAETGAFGVLKCSEVV